MAAIYPWMSPGGWNLIGAMPIPTFDLQVSASPALFEAGDVVTFFEIDAGTFQALEKSGRDPVSLRREFLVESL
jgi:allophanate hydrolase subunit 1